MARLKKYYKEEVMPALIKELGYKNPMQAPRLEKIVVNMGLGEAIQNIKILDSAVSELAMIVGQMPVVTKARKSIATFKLRKGMSIGCMVTLRQEKMYEFFDRLVNVAIPRIRDFRGICKWCCNVYDDGLFNSNYLRLYPSLVFIKIRNKSSF